ncbi:hypothetical protein OH77DRAFT_535974 [Trametes cingulata]|nr:hypothetical protein OH77DRAFT_535974 [Trametes cingulata]
MHGRARGLQVPKRHDEQRIEVQDDHRESRQESVERRRVRKSRLGTRTVTNRRAVVVGHSEEDGRLRAVSVRRICAGVGARPPFLAVRPTPSSSFSVLHPPPVRPAPLLLLLLLASPPYLTTSLRLTSVQPPVPPAYTYYRRLRAQQHSLPPPYTTVHI